MRVLFAPKEVAGQVSVLSKALRSLGVSAVSLVLVPNKFGYKVDKAILFNKYPRFFQSIFKRFLLFSSLFRFDVFHFQAGRTLLTSNRDLPLLKFFGKKVVMHFHGSEIRNPSYIAAIGRGVKRLPPLSVADRISKLSFFRKHTDKFIVSTPDLLQLVPTAYYLPNSVDERWFKGRERPLQKEKEFVVLHAPTNRDLKGTKYIVDACNNLKNRGFNIKLLLIENVPNEKVMSLYSQVDLVIDQLLIGWYGVLAIENMSMGNPVVSYVDPYLRKKYAPGLPIIQATKDNIQSVLESLIKNRDKLNKSRTNFRKYALKYHHPIKNAKRLIKIYESI